MPFRQLSDSPMHSATVLALLALKEYVPKLLSDTPNLKLILIYSLVLVRLIRDGIFFDLNANVTAKPINNKVLFQESNYKSTTCGINLHLSGATEFKLKRGITPII